MSECFTSIMLRSGVFSFGLPPTEVKYFLTAHIIRGIIIWNLKLIGDVKVFCGKSYGEKI